MADTLTPIQQGNVYCYSDSDIERIFGDIFPELREIVSERKAAQVCEIYYTHLTGDDPATLHAGRDNDGVYMFDERAFSRAESESFDDIFEVVGWDAADCLDICQARLTDDFYAHR